MTDNNDDEIESALVINIYNTVNVCLDGHALARLKAGKDTSNSASSSDAPAEGDSASRAQLESEIKGLFGSGQQNGACFNTVNISPDARFFRAGKTDDDNDRAMAAIRGILKAGKSDDDNEAAIVSNINRLLEIDNDGETNKTSDSKKSGPVKASKKAANKSRTSKRATRTS